MVRHTLKIKFVTHYPSDIFLLKVIVGTLEKSMKYIQSLTTKTPKRHH